MPKKDAGTWKRYAVMVRFRSLSEPFAQSPRNLCVPESCDRPLRRPNRIETAMPRMTASAVFRGDAGHRFQLAGIPLAHSVLISGELSAGGSAAMREPYP